MKTFAKFRRHALWLRIKLPALMLMTLLQRTPLVQWLQTTDEFVAASPVGVLLRTSIAAIASVGAMHSLAGATALISTQQSPASLTAGTNAQIGFAVSNTINIASWKIGGTLPPGMKITAVEGGPTLTGPGTLDATTAGSDDGYGGMTGGNSTTTPLLSGVPTQAGTYQFSLQAFEFASLGGLASNVFSYTIVVAPGASTETAPGFTTQPTSLTVNAGTTVTFTVAANGSPAPTYQWRKNTTPIASATNATLTLANVQAVDAGNYTCVATNSAGSVTSNAATLTVNAVATNAAPTLSSQPVAITVSNGSSAVFAIAASGTPTPTYQWRKDGTPLAGATSSTLILTGATATNAGSYSCVATNASGSVTSNAATLNVSATSDFGRIINLSVLTGLSSAEGLFTVGVSIGGSGTSGTKPLVIRAGGPALAALGVGGVLPDPKLDLFSGTTVTASNDNWGGTAAMTAAFTAVGAFPFGATSKDAAVNPTLAAGGYTVQVKDAGNASGTVIAELYDATPAGTFTPSTPRLINVSVLKQIDSGANLTVGFVIGGSTAKTVLVRVVGPTLASSFGVGGAMPDPKLDLFSGSTIIASNDNWGGDPALAGAAKSVGAFDFATAASKDAMLLITLAPGGYTVQASGAAGSAGSALIEVYEVP